MPAVGTLATWPTTPVARSAERSAGIAPPPPAFTTRFRSPADRSLRRSIDFCDRLRMTFATALPREDGDEDGRRAGRAPQPHAGEARHLVPLGLPGRDDLVAHGGVAEAELDHP